MLIYIEGNIGTGKTTFLNLLDKYLKRFENINYDARIVLEPVDEWMETKDSDGQNILEKFYSDQNKYSYIFQMNSFISRVKKINDEWDKEPKDAIEPNNSGNNSVNNSVNNTDSIDNRYIEHYQDNQKDSIRPIRTINYEVEDQYSDSSDEDMGNMDNIGNIEHSQKNSIGSIGSIEPVVKKMDKMLFVERSIYTDKHCFAENCYESGKMTKLEYDVYCKWNEWLSDEFNVRPDAYIYLRCYPNVNSDRIAKRSREGEAGIPIEYLEILHDKHDKWMAKEKETIPVLTIDALKDFNDPEVMDKIFEEIYNFVI